MSTIEDGKSCYKCGSAGKLVRTDLTPRGDKIYTFQCQNNLCPWFNTGWPVQVKSDGTLRENKPAAALFPELNDYQKTRAQAIIDDAEGKT